MLLKNKVVVVTGGSGLIGQSLSKAIVEQGGVAIIADINDPIQIGSELRDSLFVKIDVTYKESIEKCINYVHKKYGKIDALVNNAYPRNKNYGKDFFEVDYSDFVENLGMNLGGCVIPSQLFSLYFKDQGYGNIINMSSIYGVVAPKFEIYSGTNMTVPIEYAAIKSGLIHLTKFMAKYFKGMNIKVNSISPGGILDGQSEKFIKKYNEKCLNKGMLDRDDLNGTLVFLLSDMSDYMSGQNIIIDDGFCL